MQMEMERGGKLFFDLFVAMCNHMVSHSSLDDHWLTGNANGWFTPYRTIWKEVGGQGSVVDGSTH